MASQNPVLLERARELRRNMTDAERKLWYEFLREYPIRFRRQYIAEPYILDFFCCKASLAVELDGSRHYETAGLDYDARRTAFLNRQGILVLRCSDRDVFKNFSGVCEEIDRVVRQRVWEK